MKPPVYLTALAAMITLAHGATLDLGFDGTFDSYEVDTYQGLVDDGWNFRSTLPDFDPYVPGLHLVVTDPTNENASAPDKVLRFEVTEFRQIVGSVTLPSFAPETYPEGLTLAFDLYVPSLAGVGGGFFVLNLDGRSNALRFGPTTGSDSLRVINDSLGGGFRDLSLTPNPLRVQLISHPDGFLRFSINDTTLPIIFSSRADSLLPTSFGIGYNHSVVYLDNIDVTTGIPEPSTIALLAAGLLGAGLVIRLRRC